SYFVGASVLVVRRDALDQVGGFLPNLRSAEDIDVLLRLGIAPGFVLLRSPVVTAYRRHDGGLTGDHTEEIAGAALLMKQERAGQYPGGVGRARARRDIITRTVRSVSIAA